MTAATAKRKRVRAERVRPGQTVRIVEDYDTYEFTVARVTGHQGRPPREGVSRLVRLYCEDTPDVYFLVRGSDLLELA
jgi:hypothetical protein